MAGATGRGWLHADGNVSSGKDRTVSIVKTVTDTKDDFVVFLEELDHLFDRVWGRVVKQRNQEWDVVHELDVVLDVVDSSW